LAEEGIVLSRTCSTRAYLPLEGGGRSPARSGGDRVGVTVLRRMRAFVFFTPPRRALRADPPPPGEGGSSRCPFGTVRQARAAAMDARCVRVAATSTVQRRVSITTP